jgi:hypothetical protein
MAQTFLGHEVIVHFEAYARKHVRSDAATDGFHNEPILERYGGIQREGFVPVRLSRLHDGCHERLLRIQADLDSRAGLSAPYAFD